jgi:hypothetical protein
VRVFLFAEISGSEFNAPVHKPGSGAERTLGRPRRGEAQRAESSRDELTTQNDKFAITCGGFLFAGD